MKMKERKTEERNKNKAIDERSSNGEKEKQKRMKEVLGVAHILLTVDCPVFSSSCFSRSERWNYPVSVFLQMNDAASQGRREAVRTKTPNILENRTKKAPKQHMCMCRSVDGNNKWNMIRSAFYFVVMLDFIHGPRSAVNLLFDWIEVFSAVVLLKILVSRTGKLMSILIVFARTICVETALKDVQSISRFQKEEHCGSKPGNDWFISGTWSETQKQS